MKNHRLDEKKIGTATVVVDILKNGKVIPGTKITPTSITIHQTGNIGAPAKNNHNYMKNCNSSGSRIASWHFTVDDAYIYQAEQPNYKTYHAGCTSGNNTSIGIEICMFNDKERQKKAYLNAIELVKILMKTYGFKESQVKRHYDWTKKHCPAWLIEGKWGYTWTWFKNQLTTTSIPVASTCTSTNYIVKIIYEGKEGLNVRKDATTSSAVVGVVYYGEAFTIVEEKNGFGRLKSNIGWISLNSKYVKKI